MVKSLLMTGSSSTRRRDVFVRDLVAALRRAAGLDDAPADGPDPVETGVASVPPDWVCEVLTTETVAFDKARKLPVYAREGVPYAWLLDTDLGMLDVLRLENGLWAILATHGGDEVVRAEPFDEIELNLAACWAD